MSRYIYSILLAATFAGTATSWAKEAKIVGLVAVHNEAALIENCLRAMALYTDAIIVLDDASVDNTVQIVTALARECKVEDIIRKTEWVRDEKGDKQALLDAGRRAGGTHFVLLDADEMFAATCAKDDWLRKQILALKPGQIMRFPMINFWDGLDRYRNDKICSPHSLQWGGIPAVLCDDGSCKYKHNPCGGPSGAVHVKRVPIKRKCDSSKDQIWIEDLSHGILHFKFVNLQDVTVKRVWYMCLEYKLHPDAAAINNFYSKEFKETANDGGIKTSRVPAAWLAYDFVTKDYYSGLPNLRKQEISAWFADLGAEFFAPLNLGDVNSFLI